MRADHELIDDLRAIYRERDDGRQSVAMLMLMVHGFRSDWFHARDVPPFDTTDERIAWMLAQRPDGDTYGMDRALEEADRYAA